MGTQPRRVPGARSRHRPDRSKVARRDRPGGGGTINRQMGTPGPTIQIPRWVQLVGLPVLLVLAFLMASTLGHALFLFLTASVIAFMLNPLVRDLTRLRLPRALSVMVVYTIFAAIVVALLIAIGIVAFDQASNAGERIDDYVSEEDSESGLTAAERDVDGLQVWLDEHGLERIHVQAQINEWVDSLERGRRLRLRAGRNRVRPGRRDLPRAPALLADPHRRDLDLHAPRHAAARAVDRLALPAARRAAAHRADRARALGLREGPGDPVDRHRRERRHRDVDPRRDGPRRGRAGVRAAVRALDRVHRGDPVHRAVALGGAAGDLRAVRGPALGDRLGGRCSSSSSTRWRGTSSCRTSWRARCGCTRCS